MKLILLLLIELYVFLHKEVNIELPAKGFWR